MIPRVTVLATLHVVQGAEKRLGNVHDPMYVALLNQLMISEGVDFIFEEASGLGPTHSPEFERAEHDWDASHGGVCELADPRCAHEERRTLARTDPTAQI
jgi:hypothetical protein